MPITTSSQIEILPLNPKVPEQAGVIDLIRKAFFLSEEEFGYEIKIREALSQIWLRLFQLCAPILQDKTGSANGTDDKIKRMMVHIHEHYSEKISIPELAEVAFLSERECYRAFQNHLHMPSVEYIKSYRIQRARQMLADTQTPITEIGYACGLGNPAISEGSFGSLQGIPHWNTGANGRIEIKNDRIRISSFYPQRYNRHCRTISDERMEKWG